MIHSRPFRATIPLHYALRLTLKNQIPGYGVLRIRSKLPCVCVCVCVCGVCVWRRRLEEEQICNQMSGRNYGVYKMNRF